MSERWKFQLKTGLIWGLITTFIISAIDTFEMSLEGAFLSRKSLLRIFFMVLTGIFIVGYFSWKKKIKNESTSDSPHNNSIHK